MKATTLTAIALTLLMLLLVLLAAFVFLFQGQLALRDGLSAAEDTIQSLEQEEARLRIEGAAAEATHAAAETMRATTEAGLAALESQLVQSAQQAELREAQLADVNRELEAASATQAFYETSGPLVTIIEPERQARARVGDPVNLLIVASDPVGVKAVIISVDQELLDTAVTPQPNVIVEQVWVPSSAGPAIISVSAVNNSGVTSKSRITTLLVSSATPEPSATPLPTATPTPASE